MPFGSTKFASAHLGCWNADDSGSGSKCISIEALSLCDDALAFGRLTEGRCYESETRRVRAEALFALGDSANFIEVQAEFKLAIEFANRTESQLLELRAALSYVRHLVKNRVSDYQELDGARSALARVIERFDLGTDLPELQQARDELKLESR